MLYPQNGSIAIGSRRTPPVPPAAAAVVSEERVAPRKTPCCQWNASYTSGTSEDLLHPKRIAEIGTPSGFSHSGEIVGHWLAGAGERAVGGAALSALPGGHSRPRPPP